MAGAAQQPTATKSPNKFYPRGVASATKQSGVLRLRAFFWIPRRVAPRGDRLLRFLQKYSNAEFLIDG